jgi:hypothetical protein
MRYFIGVKARNEVRQGDVGVNESYNLVLISDPVNARLKKQGKTTDQITSMLLAEVSRDPLKRRSGIPSTLAVMRHCDRRGA